MPERTCCGRNRGHIRELAANAGLPPSLDPELAGCDLGAWLDGALAGVQRTLLVCYLGAVLYGENRERLGNQHVQRLIASPGADNHVGGNNSQDRAGRSSCGVRSAN